ncbi:MAG: hypothetical protein K0V04_35090 [Deltaproteobacteria bacterium]|nr:hypothetical protein [Deltaproteobacteria bacterium]
MSEVIDSPIDAAINRVRALSFPDRAARKAFYADAEHRRLLEELYEPAVDSTALIGAHDAPGDSLG